VHDIDYSAVAANPGLNAALKALNGRKLVFTAGTVAHAERVLQRLGITHHFSGIFDIVHADYVSKPKRQPYDSFLRHHAVAPASAIMFEDIARNLEVPHALGMTTVLVMDDAYHDAQHINEDTDATHIHHKTSDLAGFLQAIATEI
jgi:putative hydrolase of the HAD superfamily